MGLGNLWRFGKVNVKIRNPSTHFDTFRQAQWRQLNGDSSMGTAQGEMCNVAMNDLNIKKNN